MYHFLVKRLVNQSSSLVNKCRFRELLGSMALNVHHRFAGDHALGGVHNDQAAGKAWLNGWNGSCPPYRLGLITSRGRLAPQHVGVCPMDGYRNTRKRGSLPKQRGSLYHLQVGQGHREVHEDTLAVYTGLEKQYQAGIQEARALQIIR